MIILKTKWNKNNNNFNNIFFTNTKNEINPKFIFLIKKGSFIVSGDARTTSRLCIFHPHTLTMDDDGNVWSFHFLPWILMRFVRIYSLPIYFIHTHIYVIYSKFSPYFFPAQTSEETRKRFCDFGQTFSRKKFPFFFFFFFFFSVITRHRIPFPFPLFLGPFYASEIF